MSEANIALVRRWFDEVWNLRRDQTIDELITSESVCMTDEGPMRGPDEFRERQYAPLLTAFPDIQVEVESAIAQDDQVVVRWNATGIHSGDGLGFPRTNERVTIRGISWVQVRDGKLMEGWQNSNLTEVVRRLAERASG